MEPAEVVRAVAAALAVADGLGLAGDDAVVLHDSNKLALRLTPCDVVARVTPTGYGGAELELERAELFAAAGCPVGVAEPSVPAQVHTCDGFAVTLWTYYPTGTAPLSPRVYADALARLHAGLRTVRLASPRFTDRIADAQLVADDPALSPELRSADRELLGTRLRSLRGSIEAHRAPEQVLHGEPHPGNVLGTSRGPLFIDFETTCRGPVEFDLAHVPEAVADHYPAVDRALLDDCRQLVLAMVAAWRWRIGDEFPDRERWGRLLLQTLRSGPPWPTLDALSPDQHPPRGAGP